MKILTNNEANQFLKCNDLDTRVSEVVNRLHIVEGTYAMPSSSRAQIALSNLFAYSLIKNAPVCVYISGWGISNELPQLYYTYRESMGDVRPLIEAPVHWFDANEEENLVSLLFLIFAFCWDAYIFDASSKMLLKVNHHSLLEIRVFDPEVSRDIALDMREYGIKLLTR